jgi:hypothetical protein
MTLLGFLASLTVTPSRATQKPEPRTSLARSVVTGTLEQLRDAWLSSDAAVVGIYKGVDSTLGPAYDVVDVAEVWMGSPAPGRLVFKAPRGNRARRGDVALLFLWDRLNAASDSYLDESKRRYGEQAWGKIGPDSSAAYLLPFGTYAYPFDGDKLVLRGISAFPSQYKHDELQRDLEDYEATLQPQKLFERADTVERARVRHVEKATKVSNGIVVEYRIQVRFEPLETWKGAALDSLQIDFASFPRSPRFTQDEEVVLFLARFQDGRLYLDLGKRAVYHIAKGETVETHQPVAEFRKSLQGGR